MVGLTGSKMSKSAGAIFQSARTIAAGARSVLAHAQLRTRASACLRGATHATNFVRSRGRRQRRTPGSRGARSNSRRHTHTCRRRGDRAWPGLDRRLTSCRGALGRLGGSWSHAMPKLLQEQHSALTTSERAALVCLGAPVESASRDDVPGGPAHSHVPPSEDSLLSAGCDEEV